ncbi:major facilitator superfamily domain-containing protein 1 isoform X2 [Contarinia nasturtii]|nr:major facilitator superfamily domain-containing protein 1 isoform X2 [Contarinia nasturtii]
MGVDDELSTPILNSDEDVVRNRRTFSDDELDASNELGGCCCNPSSTCHRFIALILMCLVGFASYFCYDNPASLQNYFMKDMDMSTTQFVWLYSIYSWPNVVFCFIGGFLIDRVFGIRFGTILYMFILMIGQLIVAFGAILDAFWMMIVGRFIFGIGAESLAVAQNNYAVLWFKGKELNMVFGLQLSFARVGSTVNFIVMEPIYKYINKWYKGHMCLGVVMLISFTTCLMSFACAVLLGWLDKRAQRILQRNDNPSGDVAKLSDVKTFKISFWMVSVICVAYYVAIFPFVALGKVFFMQKYDLAPEDANFLDSLVFLISAVASPLFGFVIDKTGRNVSWMLISILTTIGAHSFLAFTYVNPYICMITMGLAYSMLASSLWPLVALIIPEYQLGTAYGICQSVQNLGLAVVSMFAGIIVDRGGYFTLEIFFICWLAVAFIATIVIWIYNSNKNGNLNMTPYERDLHFALVSSSANSKLINSESAENIPPIEGTATTSSPRIRNRYLKRIGVGGSEIDDELPLLNDN